MQLKWDVKHSNNLNNTIWYLKVSKNFKGLKMIEYLGPVALAWMLIIILVILHPEGSIEIKNFAGLMLLVVIPIAVIISYIVHLLR